MFLRYTSTDVNELPTAFAPFDGFVNIASGVCPRPEYVLFIVLDACGNGNKDALDG